MQTEKETVLCCFLQMHTELTIFSEFRCILNFNLAMKKYFHAYFAPRSIHASIRYVNHVRKSQAFNLYMAPVYESQLTTLCTALYT